MKLIMSIDVEDWFHVENLKSAIPKISWETKEYRIEKNIDLLLRLLSDENTKATFFVLGLVAEKYSDLVKKIQKDGHEIASHGYKHDIIYSIDRKIFQKDIKKSKDILEDITGIQIKGYRAPSLSITDWAIDILKEAGFKYDSSFFPSCLHDRYGKFEKYNFVNDSVCKLSEDFYEVSLSCLKVFNKNIPWAGGGYFRFIPYNIYKRGVSNIISKIKYFCFYIHPWEFDFNQPRINNVKYQYKFRHYHNLKGTEQKFKSLLHDFNFKKIEDIL